MFTHICILDSLPRQHGQLREGCFVGNAKLAALIGREDDSTVRRYLQELAEHGLIKRTLVKGRERTIEPLVSLGDALRGGWRALAYAVLDYRRAPSALKRLASLALGKTRRLCDLKKLGVEADFGQKTPRNCTGSARRFARVYPIKSDSEEATARVLSYQNSGTGIREVSLPTTLPHDPAAASLFERSAGVLQPEAVGLARWAMKIGASVEHVRVSCAALSSRPQEKVKNRIGYLKSLVKAAVEGESLSLTAAPPTHHSDLGERPGPRITVAPKPLAEAAQEKDAWLTGPTPLETALEALDEPERADLIERAVAEAERRASSPVTKKSVASRRELHPDVRAVLRELLGIENGGKS